VEKKGFGCTAVFVFTTGDEKTTIEKLYALGSDEDSEKYREETKRVANKRLERDCERLRRAGLKVQEIGF
jgi:hypothetical protein